MYLNRFVYYRADTGKVILSLQAKHNIKTNVQST